MSLSQFLGKESNCHLFSHLNHEIEPFYNPCFRKLLSYTDRLSGKAYMNSPLLYRHTDGIYTTGTITMLTVSSFVGI